MDATFNNDVVFRRSKLQTTLVIAIVSLLLFLIGVTPPSVNAQEEQQSEVLYENVIVEKNVMVPMRDGTKLAVDVYRPDAPGKFPTVLIRTPYNKESYGSVYSPFLPQRGFVVVVGDVRGRYASEGEFRPNRDDGWGENQDGYDTVEWAASQPWSNGQVFVTGASYMGSTAYLTLPTQPPHLIGGQVHVMALDPFHERFYNGGVFRLWLYNWVARTIAPDLARRALADDPDKLEEVLEELETISSDPSELQKRLEALPLTPAPIFGDIPEFGFYHDWVVNNTDGPYWADRNVKAMASRVNVPVVHVGGWYDIYAQGTINAFKTFQEQGGPGARGKQRLIMGPWSHSSQFRDQVGSLHFPGATMNSLELLLRHLKAFTEGIPGFEDEPPIKIYVMGDNVWRYEWEWPLARTKYTPYYFREEPVGSIDSLNGDKLLSPQAPEGMEEPDSYVYDPLDPVPTLGGRTLYLPDGPRDHREADRQSITYTTPPLEEDIEITGPVTAVLYASSSAPDTDWVVRLSDVYPDGTSINVTEGILRASYRESMQNPTPIVPGEVYEYKVDMWSTSQVFKKGHRIRVSITSSNFPHYARNLNTGENSNTSSEVATAQNTVYHDSIRPSHIILPVIPMDRFTDIAGHWAEPDINQAARAGLLNGYPDKTYRPQDAVTRAQFVTLLARALGMYGSGDTLTFTDSNLIAGWAQNAVALAAGRGIVTGYEDGTFRPDNTISRAELAVMLSRALNLDVTDSSTGFVDDDQIPAWAKPHVAAAQAAGLLHGRSGNRFAPGDPVTRAEAAALMLRINRSVH